MHLTSQVACFSVLLAAVCAVAIPEQVKDLRGRASEDLPGHVPELEGRERYVRQQ